MTKKKGIFETDFKETIVKVDTQINKKTEITIQQASNVVLRQLETGGCRERTLYNYDKIVGYLMRDTRIVYLADITNAEIYKWLEGMNVKNSTKLTRLKCFKVFLGRCHNNGWINNRFWKSVNVKVDVKIKEGATDQDVNVALSLMDMSKFIDLRNATAILLMYRCGLRIGTIARMTESQIDFDTNKLLLSGEVMKNHQGLILPFDDQIRNFLEVLINQNKKIRTEYKENNEYLFITMKGKFSSNSMTSNCVQKD